MGVRVREGYILTLELGVRGLGLVVFFGSYGKLVLPFGTKVCSKFVTFSSDKFNKLLNFFNLPI